MRTEAERVSIAEPVQLCLRPWVSKPTSYGSFVFIVDPDATKILHDFANSPGNDSRLIHQLSEYDSSFSHSLSVDSVTSECENLVPLVVIIHIASQYPGILIIYATFLGAFKSF